MPGRPNALLGFTLAFLGIVVRAGTGQKERPRFRLTDVGRIVFAAPEEVEVKYTPDPKFLVVQPNHEVLAYLDVADAAAVWPLAQMARRAVQRRRVGADVCSDARIGVSGS